MDIFDKEKRSEVMSHIRGRNTKPEVKLRKALFAKGFRYRTNVSKLPGKPDIVLRKYKSVIFVNGCFWHGHEGCKYATRPKSNTEFWEHKIRTNQQRDQLQTLQLEANGWHVRTVWECEINNRLRFSVLVEELSSELKTQLRTSTKLKNYRFPTYEESLWKVAEPDTE